MFSFICALPSPTSAGSCLPLFGRFTGTTAQSDFSDTYASVVRLCAFTDRPSEAAEGVLEISRFSSMLLLSVRGLSRLRRTGQPLASNAAAVLLSSYSPGSQHPDQPTFRSSITRPTNASVYASPHTSRCATHDLRSGWSRLLLSCRDSASPATWRFIPAHGG